MKKGENLLSECGKWMLKMIPFNANFPFECYFVIQNNFFSKKILKNQTLLNKMLPFTLNFVQHENGDF